MWYAGAYPDVNVAAMQSIQSYPGSGRAGGHAGTWACRQTKDKEEEDKR